MTRKMLCELFESLYRNKKTDCYVVANGQRFEAIKFLLCLYSDYFKRLFKNDSNLETITLDDDYCAFPVEKLMNYIHTSLDFENMQLNSFEIYQLTTRFEMTYAKKKLFESLTQKAADNQLNRFSIKNNQWSELKTMLLDLVTEWKQKLGDKYSWDSNDKQLLMETIERARKIESISSSNTTNNNDLNIELPLLNSTLSSLSQQWLSISKNDSKNDNNESTDSMTSQHSSNTSDELNLYIEMVFNRKILTNQFVDKMKEFSQSKAKNDEIVVSCLKKEFLNEDNLWAYVECDKRITGYIIGGLMQAGIFRDSDFECAMEFIASDLPQRPNNKASKFKRSIASMASFGVIALYECRKALHMYPKSCKQLMSTIDGRSINSTLYSFVKHGANGELPSNCFDQIEKSKNDKLILYELLQQAFESEEFADCELHLQNKANKYLLSIQSNFFESLFQIDLEEKKTGIVKLTEYDSQIIEPMIRFLHTGQLEEIEIDDNDDELHQLADYFGCEGFWANFEQQANLVNWSSLNNDLQMAYNQTYNINNTEELCSFLSLNMKKFIKDQAMWNLTPNMKMMLMADLKDHQKRVELKTSNFVTRDLLFLVIANEKQISMRGKRFFYTIYNQSTNPYIYKAYDITAGHESVLLDYGNLSPHEFIGFESQVCDPTQFQFKVRFLHKKYASTSDLATYFETSLNNNHLGTTTLHLEYDPFIKLDE